LALADSKASRAFLYDPHVTSEVSSRQRANQVRGMFSRIVGRYDLMNRLMTAGQDGRWRRLAARLARPSGALALDLATGTGDLAFELRRQGARTVIGADYCEPMLRAASRKLAQARLDRIMLATADALALPFADNSFDCVTSAFLLRNVVDLPGSLAEMRRVLRPGGRVVALELTHLKPGLRSRVFDAYFQQVVPRLGGMIAGDSSAYGYLPESLDPFPTAERLASLFDKAGFTHVAYRRVGFGALAIHVGLRSED
jgi:demethylmenaquinone methyltransferase / 2-methoxy-6-polyprenyl-1,4-benzoquinol methylase